MTNVLIGIVGVILFIALAVAAALFLGPRFNEAQTDSKAMSMTQMATQIVEALAIKRNNDGVSFPAKVPVTTLSQSAYLKALPVNPFVGDGGWPFRALYSGDVKSPDYYADVVFVSLGHEAQAQAVCASINRQSGSNSSIDTLDESSGNDIAPMVTHTSGCFRMHSLGIEGEAAAGDYVAYSRI